MSQSTKPSESSESNGSLAVTTGEWTCPVCGESQSFFIPPHSHGTPVGYLRNHMKSSWDEEHEGYQGTPDIYDDSDALESYIEFN